MAMNLLRSTSWLIS